MPDYTNPLAWIMSLYPMPSVDLPQSKPILLNSNPNIFGKNYDITKYKINGSTYDISDFRNNMFELYLNEVDPYEYGDYDNVEFDPISYYLKLMQTNLINSYNQANQSIINSAVPNGIGSILPSTAKPPLKLPDITRDMAELDIIKNYPSFIKEVDFNTPSYKFADSLVNNYDVLSASLNLADLGFTGGEKSEYDGPKGDITRGLDSTYDTILSAAKYLGPVGKVLSLTMGANKLLGNIANKLGAGTDGMTGTDAFLGSSFMLLTPFGLINGIGGLKTDTIRKDDEIFADLGADYTGTNAGIDNALNFSGKKYGTLSNPARKDTNALIAEMRRQLNVAGDIADTATTRFDLVGGMSAIAGNRRAFDMQGNYNLRSIHVGREGMKIIQRTKSILSKLSTINEVPLSYSLKEITLEHIPAKYKEGGSLELDYTWTIDYAKSKDLNWIKRWLDPNRATIPNWEVEGQVATHKLSRDSGDFDGKTMFIVYPKVQEINGELIDFTDPKNEGMDASKSAFDNKELLFFNDEKAADWFVEHYKEYAPNFDKYKEGGKFNVIPDGALHARLHHMENAENLTKKGIPVVSEDENGKLLQQCEIEKEEIIFRLEVTKKLEELEKKYSEASQKEQDELAIEAGKLLVQEILHNTIDNTNNLL